VLGIYGNSKQEAMYPLLAVDAQGAPLTGANNYKLRFPPGQLPPVDAFWSLTMYELPKSLLVANRSIATLSTRRCCRSLVKDADGGLTLYIQNESPAKTGGQLVAAPKGPFLTFMRLYRPKQEALEGKWTPPKMERVDQAASR